MEPIKNTYFMPNVHKYIKIIAITDKIITRQRTEEEYKRSLNPFSIKRLEKGKIYHTTENEWLLCRLLNIYDEELNYFDHCYKSDFITPAEWRELQMKTILDE